MDNRNAERVPRTLAFIAEILECEPEPSLVGAQIPCEAAFKSLIEQ